MMDAIQRECQNLSSKAVGFNTELQQSVDSVMEQAKQIHELRSEIGEDAERKLLSKCEANLTSLLTTRGEQKAHQDTLQSFATEIGAEPPSPSDVKAAFESSLQKRVAAAHKQKHDDAPEMRKLRKLGSGEAGTSAADEEEEEDVVMTQAETRNFKCPILQVEMTVEGEMRPVGATSCPGTCRFSYMGIHGLLKKKKSIPCPIAGCTNKDLKAKDIQESKEAVRELKRYLEERGH